MMLKIMLKTQGYGSPWKDRTRISYENFSARFESQTACCILSYARQLLFMAVPAAMNCHIAKIDFCNAPFFWKYYNVS